MRLLAKQAIGMAQRWFRDGSAMFWSLLKDGFVNTFSYWGLLRMVKRWFKDDLMMV